MVTECPHEQAGFMDGIGEWIRYVFRQWKNGTPIHDPVDGPHWLIDMVRYWDFIDSQEEQRKMQDAMKGR